MTPTAIPAHVAVDYFWPGEPSQYRIVMHGNGAGYVLHIPGAPYVWPPMKSQSVH